MILPANDVEFDRADGGEEVNSSFGVSLIRFWPDVACMLHAFDVCMVHAYYERSTRICSLMLVRTD